MECRGGGRDRDGDGGGSHFFTASKTILNQIQRLLLWGIKSNLHSIPTDCNQRDERHGWMADAHLAAESAMLKFDMAAFYTNFLRDIRDVQDEKGQITDTVPHIWGSRPADPAWGTACPLIAWYMYQYYGDTRILADQQIQSPQVLAELQKIECYVCGYSIGHEVIPESCPRCGASRYAFEKDITLRKAWELARSGMTATLGILADAQKESEGRMKDVLSRQIDIERNLLSDMRRELEGIRAK